MGIISNKCPYCDSNMRTSGRSKICECCGYIEMSSEGTIRHSNESVNINKSYDSGNRIDSSTHNAKCSDSNKQSSKRTNSYKKDSVYTAHNKKVGIIAVVIMFVLCGAMLIPTIIMSIISTIEDDYNEEDTYTYYEFEDEFEADDWNESSESEEIREIPESDMFINFVEFVFDKDCGDIKPYELEQIFFIEIDYSEFDYKTISYKLEDENGKIKSGTFYAETECEYDYCDLTCFKGLKVLHMEHDDINKEYITGLDKLTEIWCYNSFIDLTYIIDSKNITSLGVGMGYMNAGLEGIEEFSHITSLKIDGRYIYDISELKVLTNLKNLEITDGASIADFDVLHNMTELETLHIEANNIKSIDFVSDMKNLKEFTLKNSKVKNIDCLVDCKDTLEKLDIIENYSLENTDVIKKLTNLKELSVRGSSDFEADLTFPDLSNLKNLKKLSVMAYEDISNINKLTGLEELTLRSIYEEYSINNLTKLKVLNIEDTSVFEETIDSIRAIKTIERMSLKYSYIWVNIEELMNLPNLKEIDMTYCTAGFDISGLKKNESLKKLNMNGVTLKELDNNKWNYDLDVNNDIDINANTDMFLKYPNLTELSIADNGIEDISFVKGLKKLKFLNVSYNYVDDFSPAYKMENLKTVLE